MKIHPCFPASLHPCFPVSLSPCIPVSLHAKIKYQKNKTNQNSNEEDMHNRKSKMKCLQKELLEFPTNMSSKIKNAKKNAVTKID